MLLYNSVCTCMHCVVQVKMREGVRRRRREGEEERERREKRAEVWMQQRRQEKLKEETVSEAPCTCLDMSNQNKANGGTRSRQLVCCSYVLKYTYWYVHAYVVQMGTYMYI